MNNKYELADKLRNLLEEYHSSLFIDYNIEKWKVMPYDKDHALLIIDKEYLDFELLYDIYHEISATKIYNEDNKFLILIELNDPLPVY